MDQQSASQAPTFSKNFGSYLRHAKTQPVPQPKQEFVQPAGKINQADSPKSILKKQSAYENQAPKSEIPRTVPVSSSSKAMSEEQVDEKEALKTVNVSAARQLFGGQSNSTTYVKAPAPEPQVHKPEEPVSKIDQEPQPISKIPVPKQRIAPNSSQSNVKLEPEPEIIEENRFEPGSETEMAWDNDEFDLVGAGVNQKPSYVPRQAPEDFVDEEAKPEIPEILDDRGLSDSDESLPVDDVKTPTGPKGVKTDPDAQSLLSMQSITLTDTVDLQDLARKHFADESKSDSESENIIPVTLINTPPTAVRSTNLEKSKPELVPDSTELVQNHLQEERTKAPR